MTSMINQIQGNARQRDPQVGAGATILLFSDRQGATIVSVKGKKTVTVKRDKAIRMDQNGMSESQDYRFEYNPQAEDQVFTLRQNGAWVQKGQPMNSGVRLAIGYRDEYYDFTF